MTNDEMSGSLNTDWNSLDNQNFEGFLNNQEIGLNNTEPPIYDQNELLYANN